jgi:hypothetical protein
VGALTSHNPIGLHSLLQDSFNFFTLQKNRRSQAKFVPVIDRAAHTEDVWCSGGIEPQDVKRCRCLATFPHRPLYPKKNSPRCTVDKRLGGPQMLSCCCAEEVHFGPKRESNHDPTKLIAIPPAEQTYGRREI